MEGLRDKFLNQRLDYHYNWTDRNMLFYTNNNIITPKTKQMSDNTMEKNNESETIITVCVDCPYNCHPCPEGCSKIKPK